MAFSHTTASDPLGLASAGDIVLVTQGGGARKQYVELLDETGVYVNDTDAPVVTKPVEEYTIEYELKKSNLTIPLGAAINTNYFVTGLSVSQGPEQFVKVTVNVIKLSNPNKQLSPPSDPGDVEITGGFGIQNKFGATSASAFLSASMSISMQTAEAMEEASGDYLEDGWVQYGFKKECSVEAYGAVTIPVAGKVTSEDTRTGRDQFTIYAKSWFEYL